MNISEGQNSLSKSSRSYLALGLVSATFAHVQLKPAVLPMSKISPQYLFPHELKLLQII